jgi:hypothetical protein
LVYELILKQIAMNIVERAKGIILKPKEEWEKISQETNNTSVILTTYLIPLALIPTFASLIGFGLIGGPFTTFSFGIKYAIITLISYIVSTYLAAIVIDQLARSFNSEKNFTHAFALVAFSYTPMMLAGVLYILPVLSTLVFIAGIYSLYILYLGLKPMMKTPDDKVTVYFIVSLLVLIVAYAIIYTILYKIFIGSMIRAAIRY